jgi:hypothetical protein
MVITWAISVGVPTRCSGMGASKRASRSDTAESSDADVVDHRVDGPVAEDRVQCFGGSGRVGKVRRCRPGEPDHFMLVTGRRLRGPIPFDALVTSTRRRNVDISCRAKDHPGT